MDQNECKIMFPCFEIRRNKNRTSVRYYNSEHTREQDIYFALKKSYDKNNSLYRSYIINKIKNISLNSMYYFSEALKCDDRIFSDSDEHDKKYILENFNSLINKDLYKKVYLANKNKYKNTLYTDDNEYVECVDNNKYYFRKEERRDEEYGMETKYEMSCMIECMKNIEKQ